MTISDFLKDPIFMLPKIQSGKHDYIKFVIKHLDAFLEKLEFINDNQIFFDDLQGYFINRILERQIYLVTQIKDTLTFYYDGKPFNAFQSLSEGLVNRFKDFNDVLNIQDYLVGENFIGLEYIKQIFH